MLIKSQEFLKVYFYLGRKVVFSQNDYCYFQYYWLVSFSMYYFFLKVKTASKSNQLPLN